VRVAEATTRDAGLASAAVEGAAGEVVLAIRALRGPSRSCSSQMT
jgi:hypothetical protein